MAGYADGDDDFSDNDLDDLPVGALAELENNAIQLTQTQTRPKAAPSSDYGDDFDDEDLDDAVVIDESRSTPAVIHNHIRHAASSPARRGPYQQQPGTNSYMPNRQRPNVPLFHQSPSVPLGTLTIPRSTPISVRPGSQQAPIGDRPVDLMREVEEVSNNLQWFDCADLS